MEVEKPVFIIGNFRGGTSIVFRLLSESKELWSMYRESNHLWTKYKQHPEEHAQTVVLDSMDAHKEAQNLGGLDKLRKYYEEHYHFSTYNLYFLGHLSRVRFFRDKLKLLFDLMNSLVYAFKALLVKKYRIIDKTPPNCFRVSYLERVFPDAKFIYLTRNGRANTSSLINAWRDSKRFSFDHRKYLTEGMNLDIDGYEGDVWKFSHPPGWQAYTTKPLEEVCAFQWLSAHSHASKAFAKMDPDKYIQIKYEDLMANPDSYMRKICTFIDVKYDEKMQKIVRDMPLVNTSSKPSSEKQKQNAARVTKIAPMISHMQELLGYLPENQPKI